MEYIYGDVLFVINFCMDFLSLYISGKLMHMKMSRLRLIIAATAGGIYISFGHRGEGGFLTARHYRLYDSTLS